MTDKVYYCLTQVSIRQTKNLIKHNVLCTLEMLKHYYPKSSTDTIWNPVVSDVIKMVLVGERMWLPYEITQKPDRMTFSFVSR